LKVSIFLAEYVFNTVEAPRRIVELIHAGIEFLSLFLADERNSSSLSLDQVITWNDFVHVHGPPAYRTAWRILGHAQDCEDVLQEAFIEAHKLFVAGKIANPKAFLNRLVTFRALDALRRRKTLGSVDPSTFVDESLGPSERAIEHEDEMRLRAIVAELPPRQAAVFCMTHFEELSHEEIAGLLEISSNAVAMAIHKARATLREMMFKIHQEQEQ
jgi:RNA polymerase sigma-70 factor (ECF subfamily)